VPARAARGGAGSRCRRGCGVVLGLAGLCAAWVRMSRGRVVAGAALVSLFLAAG
jgi:hypothetical protein